MIIDCISDLHGYYPKLEGGDLLIVAGDLTDTGEYYSYITFCQWLEECEYQEIIVIGGNHDNGLTHGYKNVKYGFDFSGWATYLCDSGIEFEGLKVWGSPWTKTFPGMNPKCKAFTVDTEEELAEKWALIPEGTDILITHSPPYQILDMIIDRDWEKMSHPPQPMYNCVGSKSLLRRTLEIKTQFHCFGHIHECGGQQLDSEVTTFVNASLVNERYEHVNKPVRVIL